MGESSLQVSCNWREWRRLVKLDPARDLDEERLAEVCSWQVDAFVVGGTGGYGAKEVRELLRRIRFRDLPVALEVSDPEAVCPGFDLYLIPLVLNSPHAEWVVGRHQAAVKRFGELVDWAKVVAEGYCVLNPDSAVAKLTHACTQLDLRDVVALARVAENLLRLPIFYLEYSGVLGPLDVVRAVRFALKQTVLWYGGGIHTQEQAETMGAWADAVIVGNAVYEGSRPFPLRKRTC